MTTCYVPSTVRWDSFITSRDVTRLRSKDDNISNLMDVSCQVAWKSCALYAWLCDTDYELQRAAIICVTTQTSLPDYQVGEEKLCTFCMAAHTFEKAFCPITLRKIIRAQPNFYHSLPPSTPPPIWNGDLQIQTLSSEKPRTCARVRPSFPYYNIGILSLWCWPSLSSHQMKQMLSSFPISW